MKLHTPMCLLAALLPAAPAQPRTFPPEAQQIAQIIGISPLLDQLNALPPEPSLQRLLLREQLIDALFETDLDIDSVVASIQREEAQIQQARDRLSAQRDHLVNLVTVASTIAGAGIGIIGSAFQFSDRLAYAGDGVSVGSGVISTFLSLFAMRVNGGKTRPGIAPNMLARVFDRPSEEMSVWPADVWTWLNSAPPSGERTATRIDSLKADWIKQGRITTSQTSRAEQKITNLTSAFSQAHRIGLNALSDRSAMLADLRAQVALMKRDLRQLLHAIRTAPLAFPSAIVP